MKFSKLSKDIVLCQACKDVGTWSNTMIEDSSWINKGYSKSAFDFKVAGFWGSIFLRVSLHWF